MPPPDAAELPTMVQAVRVTKPSQSTRTAPPTFSALLPVSVQPIRLAEPKWTQSAPPPSVSDPPEKVPRDTFPEIVELIMVRMPKAPTALRETPTPLIAMNSQLLTTPHPVPTPNPPYWSRKTQSDNRIEPSYTPPPRPSRTVKPEISTPPELTPNTPGSTGPVVWYAVRLKIWAPGP